MNPQPSQERPAALDAARPGANRIAKIDRTLRYVGVDVEDALELAERTEV
ncbi:hypothetical protein [Sphingomonas sp. Leaf23]|nr:hypothetical protein [Sphingomonas sp. Leaf23]